MKLSIRNFKTIGELKGFNFNSINIISGVNSSGKTSFIQFLLLLKQTIEAQLANPRLVFDNFGTYESLVFKKDTSKQIGFELLFEKEEIDGKFQSVLEIENISIKVDYCLQNNENVPSNIFITYNSPQATRKQHFIKFTLENSNYKIETDTALFGEDFFSISGNFGTLNTTAFIPLTFSTEVDIEGDEKLISIAVQIKEIQEIVNTIFNNISYIGPLREEPQDLYNANKKNKSIGNRGEFAAQFLEEEANSIVEFCDIKTKILQQKTLSEAVKYWICDVFNLAKNIKAEKYKDSFIVKIVNHYSVESTIRQVGFGISQVLPIIVEGLRMNKNGVLILEQPEIHLHPKVQSALFDFIYSLSLTGKKFLIETHSDHFITRMRRRVAEDENKLSEKINLVFVEQKEAEHLFHKLNLDDMGTFDYFPVDFVEQTDDFGAIIIAQAKKAKNKQY
ncbi:MAG: AAA family ATPase [Bacteroidales bacterium]|jgi:predicted ATPase|nr:AAA family ATPase [Bacteroidales bacterium]